MNKNLVILRGIPGCGKSTFAELMCGYICCADDFCVKDGKYEWTLENAPTAHLKCQEKCRNLMKINASLIIIANTCTTIKEMKPYFDLAKEYDYKIFSIIIENRHNGKSSHDVPEEILKKMIEQFDIKLI